MGGVEVFFFLNEKGDQNDPNLGCFWSVLNYSWGKLVKKHPFATLQPQTAMYFFLGYKLYM